MNHIEEKNWLLNQNDRVNISFAIIESNLKHSEK